MLSSYLNSISNTSIVITLDLSKLNELWICMERIIDYLQKRIHECVKKAYKENPQLKERIKAQIGKRVGDNPVNIINSKYFILYN